MKAVERVTGEKTPRRIFLVLMFSSTRRSFLIRLTASCFSSGVSQRAVSGRSVRVKKDMTARAQVMMPSTAKSILHSRR